MEFIMSGTSSLRSFGASKTKTRPIKKRNHVQCINIFLKILLTTKSVDTAGTLLDRLLFKSRYIEVKVKDTIYCLCLSLQKHARPF